MTQTNEQSTHSIEERKLQLERHKFTWEWWTRVAIAVLGFVISVFVVGWIQRSHDKGMHVLESRHDMEMRVLGSRHDMEMRVLGSRLATAEIAVQQLTQERAIAVREFLRTSYAYTTAAYDYIGADHAQDRKRYEGKYHSTYDEWRAASNAIAAWCASEDWEGVLNQNSPKLGELLKKVEEAKVVYHKLGEDVPADKRKVNDAHGALKQANLNLAKYAIKTFALKNPVSEVASGTKEVASNGGTMKR